jgi:hypothetical protein
MSAHHLSCFTKSFYLSHLLEKFYKFYICIIVIRILFNLKTNHKSRINPELKQGVLSRICKTYILTADLQNHKFGTVTAISGLHKCSMQQNECSGILCSKNTTCALNRTTWILDINLNKNINYEYQNKLSQYSTDQN